MPSPSCHLCGSENLIFLDAYRDLMRASSDSKPWRTGGQLAVCNRCGASQAVVDDPWRAEAREIYQKYDIWHQSDGAEQAVFDPETNQPVTRSERLLRRIKASVSLPERGRWLDVGCGNGAMLRMVSELLPGWGLAGTEFNEKHRARVEGIPGVKTFHKGPLAEVPGKFDVISLIHVLEHLELRQDHLTIFRDIREKLAPNGLLFIEVPAFTRNPFELVIADHCTHFAEETLCDVLARVGFEIVVSTQEWVAKELSALVRVALPGPAPARRADPAALLRQTSGAVAWLGEFQALAQKVAEQGPVGVFGSSIGATFVYGNIPDRVAFFVDEDPGRVGKKHLGVPILHPRDVPDGGKVLLPIAPIVAEKIARRLRGDYGIETYYVQP